jgi:hypothetical protein
MSSQKVRSPAQVLKAERAVFNRQLGLATRAQLLNQGVTPWQVRWALAQGRWARGAAGLYALANWPDEPTRRLLAACLATNGVASHASAAWLWQLLKKVPSPLVVSVAHERWGAVPSASNRRPAAGHPANNFNFLPVVVHRSRDLTERCISTRRGVRTTNPLRTLVDMAADASPALLDEAIDTALATRLLTVEALLAEAARMKHPGRKGPARLVKCLKSRAFVGAPSPSVLESRALRLLARAGVRVVGCEVVADEHHYRLDIQLEHGLFVEVDGYAYHWSPEQKRHDDARRNRLRLLGYEILVYDWQAVVNEPGRVVAEVKEAQRPERSAMRARAGLAPYGRVPPVLPSR